MKKKIHEWTLYKQRNFIISNRKDKDSRKLRLRIIRCRKCGKSKIVFRIFSKKIIRF